MRNAAVQSDSAACHRFRFGWPLIIIFVWLGFIGGIELIRPEGNTTSLCLFRNVTGMPCPTCGSTRAVLALARGELLQAVMFNPLLIAAMFGGTLYLALPRAMKCGLRKGIAARPAVIWIVLSILLAANWAYLLWREM